MQACDLLHKKGKKEGAAPPNAVPQSPSLTSLFSVGQFVRCAVIGLQQGGGKAQGGRGESVLVHGKHVRDCCLFRDNLAPSQEAVGSITFVD
jgi:hypothetical protein